VGTLVAMIIVGRLLNLVEARYLVFTGLTLATFTLHQMVGFTEQTSSESIHHRESDAGLRSRVVFRAVEHGRLCNPARPSAHGRDCRPHAFAQPSGARSGFPSWLPSSPRRRRMHANLAEFITPFTMMR
jgi:DHA2 family multidrug resistance protein